MQVSNSDPERQLLNILSTRDPFPQQVVGKGLAREIPVIRPTSPGPQSESQNLVMESHGLAWQTREFTICTLSNAAQSTNDMAIPDDAIIL